MKLLFDENLSPKLPTFLEKQFPESIHVRDCGLKGKPDLAIWEFARANGFTLVSKDGDFYQRSILLGPPPKFVWLCVGNCTRNDLVKLILKYEMEIRALDGAGEAVLLIR